MHDQIADILGPVGGLWARQGDLPSLLPVFERPLWLLLIPPLCLLAWAVSRRSLAFRERGGFSSAALALLIRGLAITLLAAALARPQLRWQARDVAVVAVVDTSASVPADQRRLADEFLASALARRGAGDRLGVVTVSREALAESLPTSSPPIPATAGAAGHGASDLGAGLELARALLPPDAAGRVLLISDGNDTGGSLARAAASLGAAKVPVDVAPAEYDRSGMVRLEDVVLPAWAREGDTINARVILRSGAKAAGRLSLLLDGEMVDLDAASDGLSARVELAGGVQALSVPLRLPPGGVHTVEAVFEPDNPALGDPLLLRGRGVVFAGGPLRVLVLAQDERAAGPLTRALSSDELRLELRHADSAPSDLQGWAGYDAVVLADQPASSFSQSQQESLAQAVRDAGLGLLVVGGPESYGAGGWIGSPLADALPLLLDPPHKRELPMGALVLIIDRSGSMASGVAGTLSTQQQLANEAAILGVRALSRLDEVAVIAFSSQSEVVVPLTPRGDGAAVERRIRAIGPGGGTDLFPALEAAAGELAKSRAGARHVVVLTDGQTAGEPGDGLALAQRLRQSGATLSTVAIGDQSNDPLLKKLALTGGGRAYSVASQNARALLPQIFIKEARTVRRALIREGLSFAPSVEDAGFSLGALPAPMPAMTGYVVTADRSGLASVLMRGPEGDPILARWQHGLGRVAAYTGDAATRWNAAWVADGSFQPFWHRLLAWTARPSGNGPARVHTRTLGERAIVSVDLLDARGERANFASVTGRAVSPEGKARDVEFRQNGPGRYEAEFDAKEAGAHLVSIRYAAGLTEGTARAAVVRKEDEELREPRPDAAALRQIAERAGGRVLRLGPSSGGADLWSRADLAMPEVHLPAWPIAAAAALAIFLLDVAARRVHINPARLRARLAGVLLITPAKRAADLASLRSVRDRARAAETPLDLLPRDLPPREVAARPTTDAPPAHEEIAAAPPPPGESDDVMSRLRAAKRRGRQ